MFEHKSLQRLDEYFETLNTRKSKGVYFYRINSYNETIRNFMLKFYKAARLSGVVIEGKIPNPDEKNLEYYNEIMGMDFQLNSNFIAGSLKKWLPRMNDYQRNNVAASIYHTLEIMHQEGKNDNMLKNAYIKFMCWLYYKFERIVNQLGNEQIPKILYEGNISNYELKLITILCNSGCDIVLLQYSGDGNYLKLDPESKLSNVYCALNGEPFPSDFSIKKMREEIENEAKTQKLYGVMPQITNCTNAWIDGFVINDILKSSQSRGSDLNLFYNCFCRINGVEDKLTYMNDLYQFYLQLKNNQRKVVIVENSILQPTMEEIGKIKRNSYHNVEQLIVNLSYNIQYTANIELQRMMNKAFVEVVIDEGKQPEMNINRLTNKAVILLCWLKRYQGKLFSNWKYPEISCFIYMGGCKNENEAMFIKFLSKLPIDVLILCPNLNVKCCLEAPYLYEKNNIESLPVEKFPCEKSDLHMGTAAYHAERELDTIMYQDSGMYRNQQYGKAVSVTLQTMYEEIAILWDQELKYRPNFSVLGDTVTIPVIFAKVSGVKDGMVSQYWSNIKLLNTEDTFIIKNVPWIHSTDENPIKAYATEFFKNGKVQRNKIKNHKIYQYGFLREEVQEHIFDKLQLLIEQKLITGTFENGTEYTIVSTILNLSKDLIRMIQKFDFTKKNPKLIYINTSEKVLSLEDSIMAAFLNLIGFDILFFIPTGYQNIEKFFNKKMIEEHQIGDYVYDLQAPEFGTVSQKGRRSWREKLFKRGN